MNCLHNESLGLRVAALLLLGQLLACGPRMPSGETELVVLAQGVELDGQPMEDLDGALRISFSHHEGRELDVTIRLGEGVRFRRLAEVLRLLTVGPEDGLLARATAVSRGQPVTFAVDSSWVYVRGPGEFEMSSGGNPLVPLPQREFESFVAMLLSERPAAAFVVASDGAAIPDDLEGNLRAAGAGTVTLLQR